MFELSKVMALGFISPSLHKKTPYGVGIDTDEFYCCCYYFSNVNFVSEGQREMWLRIRISPRQ